MVDFSLDQIADSYRILEMDNLRVSDVQVSRSLLEYMKGSGHLQEDGTFWGALVSIREDLTPDQMVLWGEWGDRTGRVSVSLEGGEVKEIKL